MRWLPLLALVGCDAAPEDTDVEDLTPRCDGRLQPGESSVDAPWDVDGDGFFDATNPDCAANLTPDRLDCDDTDAEVRPGTFERPCDGIDNDCNPVSEDDLDEDGDGVGRCDDCDDNAPFVAPGLDEICFDAADNDCDGVQDEDCGEDYNGSWQLEGDPVQVSCALLGVPLVGIDFDRLLVTWNPPNSPSLTVSTQSSAGGTSLQPGSMNGDADVADGAFTVERTAGAPMFGVCQELFSMTGTFTSDSTMTATFTWEFVPNGVGSCGGCALAGSAHLTGTKLP